MKYLIALFAMFLSFSVLNAQSVEYTQGSSTRAISFRGGLYLGKTLFLGRYADTTRATVNPSRIGAIYIDSTDSSIYVKRSVRNTSVKEGTQKLYTGRDTSFTIDFGSVAADSTIDSTKTVYGATTSDWVILTSPAGALIAGVNFSAFVSAANTVKIRCINPTGTAKNPASGVFRLVFLKP